MTLAKSYPAATGKVQWRYGMPALLTSLTAVERLAAQVNGVPADFSKALSEDLEYARFGAALPELPSFADWKVGLAWLYKGEQAHFSRMFHHKAPVAFGVKAAELVSNGALVGTEPGLAFVAGYFTQLCVARALEPILQRVMVTHRRSGEAEHTTRRRLEWSQALFLLQELHGSTLVGTSAIREKLRIRKRNILGGVGRGLYELMRVSSLEAFGEAPLKSQVDSWMRGMVLFSAVVSSPAGRLTGLPRALAHPELYRGDGIDVFASLEQGLGSAREVLTVLGSMIRRNSFGSHSRIKLHELLPEGSPPQVIGHQRPPPRPPGPSPAASE